jgi:phosphoribosylanthranilate isomerase
MKTFVKFCGLSTPEALAEVPSGGAAGFVIGVPDSPRNVTPDRARDLIGHLPSEVEAWAVVVRPSAELIRELFDEVGVDRAQVYGAIPEGLEYLVVHHLVPSVPIPVPGAGGEPPKVPAAEDFPRVHLDAAGQASPGGSGVRPDWAVCADIVDRNPGRKFVLGGGLDPTNVGEALAIVRPWGVDVSSGIEASPGVKDLARMRQFTSAVERFEKGDA